MSNEGNLCKSANTLKFNIMEMGKCYSAFKRRLRVSRGEGRRQRKTKRPKDLQNLISVK